MFSVPALPELTILLTAKLFFYVVLSSHVLHYRMKVKNGRLDKFVLLPCFNVVYGVLSLTSVLLPSRGKAARDATDSQKEDEVVDKKNVFKNYATYEEAIGENRKYIGWIHGAIVFLSLWCFRCAETSSSGDSADSADSPFRYVLGSLLVYFIYDGGAIHTEDKWFLFCINLHHIGCVIAFLYQGAHVASDWQNMCLYSHLWSIHSFGFIQDVILPLLGIKKMKEGQKSIIMEVVRYVYAAGSVYHFYWYLNAQGQPGLGWNHQTPAMITMLGGRLLAGGNFKNVDWIRRVELPGYIFVLVGYFFCNGDVLSATFITAALYTIVISCLVMKPRKPKPERMIVDTGVRDFINDQWEKRQSIFAAPKPASLEQVRSWWKKQGWAEMYPLHDAVILGDEDTVRALLTQGQDDHSSGSEDSSSDIPSGFFQNGLRQRNEGADKSSHVEESIAANSGDEHPCVGKRANMSPNTPMKEWYECTPLHFACHMGLAGISLQLLIHGGNPWLPISAGIDATSLAKNAGHKELVTFFEELVPIVFRALSVDEKTLEEMKNPPLRKRLAEIL